MTNDELNRLALDVWTEAQTFPKEWVHQEPGGKFYQVKGFDKPIQIAPTNKAFCMDYNAAHELIDVVCKQAKGTLFIHALLEITNAENAANSEEEHWLMQHATPRELTIAALAALGVKSLEEMMGDGQAEKDAGK